jgi:hypothetical protein
MQVKPRDNNGIDDDDDNGLVDDVFMDGILQETTILF